MIEFCSMVIQSDNWRNEIGWREIPKDHTYNDCLLEFIQYRIQGKVYKRFSKTFEKAFEQERIWEQLQQ